MMGSKKNDPLRVEFALSRIEGINGDAGLINEIMERFGCGKKAAVGSVKEAYELLAEESKAMIPFRKIRMRMSLEKLIIKSMTNSEKKGTTHGYAIAIKAMQELCKIDGLYAPEIVEVEDKRKKVENMTPEEQRREIAGLVAKRDAAGLPKIDGLAVLDKN
ncbi:MAG: hypothetical protein GY814_04085 [Gammaproteobacteria bacterium]|nr:hypothetical protein [Gammaproteobacteria bacterium]